MCDQELGIERICIQTHQLDGGQFPVHHEPETAALVGILVLLNGEEVKAPGTSILTVKCLIDAARIPHAIT